MANEILSTVRPIRPAPAHSSGRFVESQSTDSSASRTQNLPQDGKVVPHRSSKSQKTDNAELQLAVNQINEFVQSVQRDLLFSMDDDSGRTVIKVMDRSTGELVRQIPSEEVLALVTHFVKGSDVLAGDDETLQGFIFSEQA